MGRVTTFPVFPRLFIKVCPQNSLAMTKQQKEELLQRALEALALEKDSVERMVDHLYSQKPLLEEGSPFSELLQKMVNLMLEGEMDDFLESERTQGKRNKRNGHIDKTVLSHVGPLKIRTSRDRHGDFEPQLVQKRQRVLGSGIDNQILALYAQGNSAEDVRRLLRNLYGISISAGKISAITDRILPEIQAWRERQLRSLYAVMRPLKKPIASRNSLSRRQSGTQRRNDSQCVFLF